MITYDQMSAMRQAFHEAHVPADRRRSQRIRQQVHAEIAPWNDNRAGPAFGVVVEDFSTTGIGLRHAERLKLGSQYLLEIPRLGQRPLSAVFRVVRCDENVGGWFNVELAPDELLDVAVNAATRQNKPPQQPSAGVALAILVALVSIASAATIFLL